MNDFDSDGIIDKIDSCLTLPETYNNFEDEDGCPEFSKYYDSDNDGIFDDVDNCKFELETYNNFEDKTVALMK